MIKAILFDFDGVLTPINSALKRELKLAIINKTIESKAMTQEKAIRYFKKALRESEYDEDYFRLQDAALRIRSFDQDEINSLFHLFSKKYLRKLQPRFVKMLVELYNSKLILGLVSLSSNERIEKSLKETGIRGCFRFVESAACDFKKASRTEWKKTAFLDFLNRYKLASNEVLCVGDSFSIDLQPAIMLGMHTVLISHRYGRKQSQNKCADYTISRSMLPDVLPLAASGQNITQKQFAKFEK